MRETNWFETAQNVCYGRVIVADTGPEDDDEDRAQRVADKAKWLFDHGFDWLSIVDGINDSDAESAVRIMQLMRAGDETEQLVKFALAVKATVRGYAKKVADFTTD